jgi:hypothetical protein
MQLLSVSVLALLVGDTAAGLASGLAGSLALAAATVLSAVAQVTGLDSLDMLHNFTFYNTKLCIKFSTMLMLCQSLISPLFSYVREIFSLNKRSVCGMIVIRFDKARNT